MTRADLLQLVEEIRADRRSVARHAELIRGALAAWPWEPDAPVMSVVAVSLHHYYSAIEAIAERVTIAFDVSLPKGGDWHARLIESMALALPTVRPAVFSALAVDGLRRLLRFRHFFRHAYRADWDPAKLRENAEVLLAVESAVAMDLDRFEAVLTTAADT